MEVIKIAPHSVTAGNSIQLTWLTFCSGGNENENEDVPLSEVNRTRQWFAA